MRCSRRRPGRWGGAKADWREQNGHVLWAPNFATVFDGRTGAALDSVPFRPDVLGDASRRAAKDVKAINREWSSRNPGNQAFRFLSAVAYLDGVRPSVVMCRGYYSRTCLWALDWDGKNLRERWYFCSDEPRWWGYGGQGFHNLRVADVDFGDAVDSNHGSKGCPCLVADIFGDWREEILLRRKDNRAIRVLTSAEPTKWRFHTFMEDPVYRASVLTQNNGYNIPTGTDFYFGPDLLGHGIEFRGTKLK